VLLEIRTRQPRQAARLLREQLADVQVGLFGDRVHLVCGEPAAAEAAVRAVLSAAEVAIIDIRTVEPSLEDVFIAVLGDGGKG